ncbi:MAG: hypothetical protein KDE03_02645 [Rhodobacteraceae bacterium]|nr:hypothetical protein [Paracoccaceae bacterium]
MVDRNMQRFYGRLGRIERIHEAGGGFEAEGTLGMSYYNRLKRPARRRLGLFAPLVMVLVAVVVIKATVHTVIGPDLYQERIAALRDGTAVGAAGAYVLQADPLTVAVSDGLRALIH